MGLLLFLVAGMEEAGEKVPLFPVVLQGVKGRSPAGDVNGVIILAELDDSAVVHGHILGDSRLIAGGDFMPGRYEVNSARGLHMIPHPLVAFGRSCCVVECDAG